MRRGSMVAVIALAAVVVVGAIAAIVLWMPRTTGSPEPAASLDGVTATDFCYVESEIYYGVEAIEMADAILAKEGIDDDVRAYAEELRDETAADVEELRAWYLEWIDARPLEPAEEGPCAGHADHAQMPGMPSWSERLALADAEGAEAEALYLELMTTQAQGRIGVAEEFLAASPHPRIIERAEGTVSEGNAELDRLAGLAAE